MDFLPFPHTASSLEESRCFSHPKLSSLHPPFSGTSEFYGEASMLAPWWGNYPHLQIWGDLGAHFMVFLLLGVTVRPCLRYNVEKGSLVYTVQFYGGDGGAGPVTVL